MSLDKLFCEMLDPRNVWVGSYASNLNDTLKAAEKQLGLTPRVDIYKVEGGVELYADLPGMSKGDVKVTVEENMVTLSGERTEGFVRDEENVYYSERHFGEFSRQFRLPFNADPSMVSGKFDNGVLKVSVPRPEVSKPSEITIE
jgi:HSP20 family protein